MANRRIFAMIQKAEVIRQSQIEKNPRFTFALLSGETITTDLDGAFAFLRGEIKFTSCMTESRAYSGLADLFNALGEDL